MNTTPERDEQLRTVAELAWAEGVKTQWTHVLQFGDPVPMEENPYRRVDRA